MAARDRRVEIRASASERTRWSRLAFAERVTLSDWIRKRCNAPELEPRPMPDT